MLLSQSPALLSACGSSLRHGRPLGVGIDYVMSTKTATKRQGVRVLRLGPQAANQACRLRTKKLRNKRFIPGTMLWLRPLFFLV